MKQLSIIQNSVIKLKIILVRNNIVVLKLYTGRGIFWKIFYDFVVYFLNMPSALLIKNTARDCNISNIFKSYVIKNTYMLLYSIRYYLKLKGLGFSFKYLVSSNHILLLNIGFSKACYVQIPKTISIITKPRKKKNIFVLLSWDNALLLDVIVKIRKLKKPDPYKLKGFRYMREALVIKTGKKKK